MRREQAIRNQEKPGTRQVPQGRERKKTAVEGGAKREIEGQLRPYGSRRRTNQMPPH